MERLTLQYDLVHKNTDIDLTDAASHSTFENWNNYLQNIYPCILEGTDAEWGISNLELRKFIWEAEHSGDYIPVDNYFEHLTDLRNGKKVIVLTAN